MFLRPLSSVFFVVSALLLAPRAPATVQGGTATAQFEAAIAESLDSVYMMGVARRGAAGPEVFEFIGTGWVIADGKLATNAHIAEALLEASFDGRLVAKRSWSDRDELALSAASVRIHPAYGPWNARLKRVIVRNERDPNAARSLSFIPIADVATVDVEAGSTALPLRLADTTKVEPVLSEVVVYLGFPHENLAGLPTLHAVPGHVTAKTDFFFQRVPWPDSYLIHYCGPVVGGASGSPILNQAGQVIGLISAAESNLSANGERTSFGFAYGQRVDLVRELLTDDFEKIQAGRDGAWSQRLSSLLIPPDELLEQLALQQVQREGVQQLSSANTVMRRQGIVKQDAPARLQVVIEPGVRYGFLAATHDGSDIDARLYARESDELLAFDSEFDYFPMMWVGPFDARTAVRFEVGAAERLLADATCSMHIYKFEPLLVDVGAEEENVAQFFNVIHTNAAEITDTATWRFRIEAGSSVMFTGESPDGYDIDLILARDGEIVDSDETPDAVPLILHSATEAGILELRLRIPAGTPAGALIQLRGLTVEGATPVSLDPPAERADPYSDGEMHAFLDELMAGVWQTLGATGEQVAEAFVVLDGELRVDFDVPAGVVPIFLGLAPHGEDIDMELHIDGVLTVQDVEDDSAPILALPSVDTPRKVTMRIFESLPDVGVPQAAYRYSLAR